MKAILISVALDENWILSHMVSGSSSVVSDVLAALEQRHTPGGLFILSREFQRFSAISCREEALSEAELREILSAIVEDSSVKLTLEELTTEKLSEKLSALREKLTPEQRALLKDGFSLELIAPPTKKEVPSAAPATTSLEDLIGLSPLKTWVRETEAIANTAAELARRAGLFTNTAWLISINRGCGLTTVLDIMAQTLQRHDLIQFSGKTPVVEWNLDYSDDPREFASLAHLAQVLQSCAGNGPFSGIVAINIEAWLDHLNESNFQKFLRFVWSNKGRFLFVFTLPYAEDDIIRAVSAQISDLMCLRVMKFIPPSDKEFFAYFKTCLAGFEIAVDEDAFPAFTRILACEKSDGKFYGFNTVLKITNELLYQMVSTSALNAEPIKTALSQDDLLRFTAQEEDSDLSGLAQLDGMVALCEVKQKVQEILSAAKLQKELYQSGKSAVRPCFHMMFSGNPGTGKTVVARIIGKIFKEAGLLSVGNFFEVSRQDFIGKFVGHTAPKAMELCRNALGSVLFIDEAYTLANDSDTFSGEAIGTLIAEMENHRDDMVVIFAGYAKELEDLLAMNPGLKDRIPHKIHFPNYTRDELREIFYLQLRDKMEYDEAFAKKADETFANLPDSLLCERDFSNGRFVRNLVERIVSKAAMRFELSGGAIENFRLTECDFSVAVADNDFSKLFAKPQKSNRIGF